MSNWAIVLAAGDGSRLRSSSPQEHGDFVPKQYCSLEGGPSMLCQARRRAETLVSREQVLVVVAERQRALWEPELADLPRDSIVIQPSNRGTAPGILLPFLAIFSRDPQATVLVLPSDHHVDDEDILIAGVRRVVEATGEWRDGPVLLGVEPDGGETSYGFVVPETDPDSSLLKVSSFVEKPSPSAAKALRRRGAVWSSFLFAAAAEGLLASFHEATPWLLTAFLGAASQGGDPRAMERLYTAIPPCDFSLSVLQRAAHRSRLVMLPPCGWIDVGTPQSLARRARRRETTEMGTPGARVLSRA